MQTKLATVSGATSAKRVCQRPKDRASEDPSAYKPLMRKPRQTGNGINSDAVGAGGTSSPLLHVELQMFDDTRKFLRREFEALQLQPAGARRNARIAEIKVRSQQLLLDVVKWIERNA